MFNVLNVLGILHMNRNVFMLLIVSGAMAMSMQTKAGEFFSEPSVKTYSILRFSNDDTSSGKSGWYNSGPDGSGYVDSFKIKFEKQAVAKRTMEQKQEELIRENNKMSNGSSSSSSITE